MQLGIKYGKINPEVMDMKTIKTRVCVLGAGAGGTGAVYRLIKNGIKTTVIDKYPDFGGTSVFCGVDGCNT